MNYIDNPGPLAALDFISAKNPKALRRAMLRNNLKQKGFVVYEFVQWVERDGLWYAWFYIKPQDTLKSVDEIVGNVDGDN